MRPATEADAPFLAEAIISAEGSGGKPVTYQGLFNFTDQELQEALTAAAAEDLPGCELCYPNFLIAETPEAEPVAACAGWLEAEEDVSSNLIKAQLLPHVVGLQRWKSARERLRLFAGVSIARSPGALQLDEFYVRPAHRRKGLVTQLIAAHRERFAAKPYALEEIILSDANTRAQKAYQKAGFTELRRTHSEDPALRQVLNGNGLVLLQRQARP